MGKATGGFALSVRILVSMQFLRRGFVSRGKIAKEFEMMFKLQNKIGD